MKRTFQFLRSAAKICACISLATASVVMAQDKPEPAVPSAPTEQQFTRVFKLGEQFFPKLKQTFAANDGENEGLLLRRYFAENGVKLIPPDAIFYSDTRKQLFVRTTTLARLVKMETLISKVLNAP